MSHSRNLIKQIEALACENCLLKINNGSLREENERLRGECARLKGLTEAEIMAAAECQAAPLRLEISALEAVVADMGAEIHRLNAIINKDSTNSSKPPRTDGFKAIQNNREKGARKRGGQPGHVGHSLKIPENLDRLIEEGKAVKRLVDYTNGAEVFISKWVVDVEIKTVYTEIRYPTDVLLPPELSPEVVYGNGIKALAVLLEQEGVVAIKRISGLFSTITGGLVAPSKASIESFFSQFAASIDGDIAAIRVDLLDGPVINTDDTPMRCAETCEYDNNGAATLKTAEGKTFSATVRTYSNEKSTLFTINPKKDDEGIVRDGMLILYCGILGHDHEIKFYKYTLLHATCCEHLCRDLKGLRVLFYIQWADIFRAFLYEMNSYKKKRLADGKDSCDADILNEFMDRYDTLVAAGNSVFQSMSPKKFGYDELRKMLARLRDYKDAYTLFIRDFTAPFTNNLAERDLRSCKTRQNISGCFRTWRGISDYVKSKSVISTWKK